MQENILLPRDGKMRIVMVLWGTFIHKLQVTYYMKKHLDARCFFLQKKSDFILVFRDRIRISKQHFILVLFNH